MTDWMRTLLEAVADGSWHGYGDLVERTGLSETRIRCAVTTLSALGVLQVRRNPANWKLAEVAITPAGRRFLQGDPEAKKRAAGVYEARS